MKKLYIYCFNGNPLALVFTRNVWFLYPSMFYKISFRLLYWKTRKAVSFRLRVQLKFGLLHYMLMLVSAKSACMGKYRVENQISPSQILFWKFFFPQILNQVLIIYRSAIDEVLWFRWFLESMFTCRERAYDNKNFSLWDTFWRTFDIKRQVLANGCKEQYVILIRSMRLWQMFYKIHLLM